MKNKAIGLTVLIVCLLLTVTGCRGAKTADGYERAEKSEFLMGTLVTIKVFHRDRDKADRAVDRAFDRVREIEGFMSASQKSSELNRINQKAGLQPVKVSGDTLRVVERGLYYGGLSGGLFDITVGPLVNLWGIGTDNPRIPANTELENALGLIDYRDVEVNKDTGEVFLKRQGMALDLGGIAKGYAADEVKKLLASEGVKHAIINLGGNVLTIGARYDGKPWNIGIKDPAEPTKGLLGIARITDGTIVTSGDYERYFEKDGRRYHHILNPFTGYPGGNGIRGVTIITTSSLDADALSTVVFLLGLDKGMELAESLDGVEAVVITEDRQVVLSSGIKDAFSLSKADYKIR